MLTEVCSGATAKLKMTAVSLRGKVFLRLPALDFIEYGLRNQKESCRTVKSHAREEKEEILTSLAIPVTQSFAGSPTTNLELALCFLTRWTYHDCSTGSEGLFFGRKEGAAIQ